MTKRRIGVLTGGGDCAGLSPAVKWVVKTALDGRLQRERGISYEVLGIHDGWRGLVHADPGRPGTDEFIEPLDQVKVRTWDRYGGTFLGASRTNPYASNDYNAIHFDARFFVVSPTGNRDKFQKWVATAPFQEFEERYNFRTYPELFSFYKEVSSFTSMRQRFLKL